MPESGPAGDRSLGLRLTAVVGVVTVIAALWLSGIAPSSSELREWGDDLGAAGPLLWPLIFALVNFAVPWPILSGATGAVFGTAAGTPIALAGILLASTFQFRLARTAAGEHLRGRAMDRLPRLDAMLHRNGFLAVFYSRIIPGVVWGVVNYAAGLARVRLRDLLLATVAGGTPKIFAYVALGGSLDDLSSPEAKVAVAVWIAVAIIGLVVARHRFRSASA